MTTTILIIVNVFAALAIIGLTLMQQSKGDMGSAFGGGSSQSMFGSRGSANFLSRATSLMCVVFFASSLALAYVYAQRAESSSVIGDSVIGTSADPIIVPITDEGVPTIPGIESTLNEALDTELPSIPDATQALESELPSIPDAAEVIQNASDAVEQSVPAVPE